MKKFIVSILCAATFFIGLGGLIEGVGAKFKSDERALELLRRARQAVGGEQSISAVRSMTVTGRVTKTFDFDGTAKSEQGDWEMNLQLPNQLSKTMKLRREGAGGEKLENVDKDVIVVRQSGELKEKVTLPAEEGSEKKRAVFVMKNEGGDKVVVNGDGTNVEAKKVLIDKVAGAGGFHQNELFRMTLALLLTSPQGVDATYKYAGEGSVDGASCDIIEASANGSNIRLYLDKSSHLPLMMSYQAPKPFVIKLRKEDVKADGNGDVKVFRDKLPAPELAEFQVRFSDYRSVGGVQLPHRWTQTIGGKEDETIDITGYELNPANIADKFKEGRHKVFVRTAKPQ
jgi:hypothetical protein